MSRVHLERIEVRELFGRAFDRLQLKGLTDRVTVVYGPNAAGKTVLAEGASRVFNAARNHVKRYDRIIGLVRVDGQSYEVDLAGPKESPAWPQSARVGLYRLSISDLIEGPHDEDVKRIREALSGGFDFERIDEKTAGQRPKRDLDLAREALQTGRQDAEALRQRELELPGLVEKLAEARAADADRVFVSRWLEAASHSEQADAKAAQLDALAADYPGIARQADNAVQEVGRDWENYQTSRDLLRNALQDLRPFGGLRARTTLQVADGEQLARLAANAERLIGALAQSKSKAQLDATQRDKSQKELNDHVPDGRRPRLALTPADRQDLAAMVSAATRLSQAADEFAARQAESARALADAKNAYRHAGGDPDHHPAVAPGLDRINALLDLDSQTNEALGREQRAREALEHAQSNYVAAKSGLNVKRVPTRQIFEQLQKKPSIAELMDRVRASETKKRASELVAQRIGQEAERKREPAEGAEAAADALRDWLRSIPDSKVAGRPIVAISLSFAFAAVGLGVALVLRPLPGAIVAASGLVVVGLLLLLRRPTRNDDGRAEVAGRVPEKWRPAEWAAESVAAQFALAADRAGALAVGEQAAREAGIQAGQMDDPVSRKDLNDRKALFARETGIKLGNGYDLADLVDRLEKLRHAGQSYWVAGNDIKTAAAALNKFRADRQSTIQAMGAAGQDGAAAKAWADALRTLIAAGAAHIANAQAAVAADDRVAKAREALAAFFQRFGWPVSGDPQIAQSGFEKWHDLTRRMADADLALDHADQEVERVAADLSLTREAIAELFHRYSFPCSGNPIDGVKPFREWFDRSQALERARRSAKVARRQLVNRLRENGIPDGLPLSQLVLLPAVRNESATQRRQLIKEVADLRAKARGARSLAGWEAAFERLNLGREPGLQQLREANDLLATAAARVSESQDRLTTTRTLVEQAAQAGDLANAEKTLAVAVSKLDSWMASKLDDLAAQAVRNRITEAVRVEAQPQVIRRANVWLGRFTCERFGELDADDDSVSVCDGIEENRRKKVEQLSTGTRVHLALAVRLAVIENAEEQGGQRFPLFLDEVMATSDPSASRAIADAVRQIADDRQVIVLTNQPEDLNVLRGALGQTLPVFALAGAQPPEFIPPTAAPEASASGHGDGIPLASSISQWRPALVTTVFPEFDRDARTVHEAKERVNRAFRDGVEVRLAAIEAVRSKCAAAHRRIQWGDIESLDWIRDAFRDRVRQALEASEGEPAGFLDRFSEIDRMREDKKRACEQWLIENGYRIDPPSLKDLAEVASESLPIEYPNRRLVAQGLAAFFAAYASR